MVELEPDVWVQASHVSVVSVYHGQTKVVLNSGFTLFLNGQTPEQVLRKMGASNSVDPPPWPTPTGVSMTRVQGVAWVWEYSGNDWTWKVYRTTSAVYSRPRNRRDP